MNVILCFPIMVLSLCKLQCNTASLVLCLQLYSKEYVHQKKFRKNNELELLQLYLPHSDEEDCGVITVDGDERMCWGVPDIAWRIVVAEPCLCGVVIICCKRNGKR